MLIEVFRYVRDVFGFLICFVIRFRFVLIGALFSWFCGDGGSFRIFVVLDFLVGYNNDFFIKFFGGCGCRRK